MAYAKNPIKHISKTRSKLYGIRSTIITIISLAILVVILVVLASFFNTPERTIKSKIESMAADYYENYFYQDIISYKTTESKLKQTMKKYEDTGFSRVALQQLLLYDGQKHADAANTIKEYCDEAATFVQFYPIEPYGQKDYHVEIEYSCEF